MFEASFDPVKRRLYFRYTGFWSLPETREVQEQFRSAVVQAAAGGKPFTILDDMRDWQPQSQDIVDLNTEFSTVLKGMPISRNAMVIPSVLTRRQVERTTDLENITIFDSLEKAEAWLAEVEPDR